MGRMIDLTATDGVKTVAYRADPPGKPKAGLVVVQEIFGVTKHIRSVADRFAERGYLAVAPAMFERVEPDAEVAYSDAARGRNLRGATTLDQNMADIAAAVAVAAAAGKVGIIGYCWGGLLAYVAAGRVPGLSAAVGYYGGGIAQHLDIEPKIPVMLHFGELDAHIPLSDVDAVKARYPKMPVFLYPADHGFNCDDRPVHEPKSAAQALDRTLGFLEEHLR